MGLRMPGPSLGETVDQADTTGTLLGFANTCWLLVKIICLTMAKERFKELTLGFSPLSQTEGKNIKMCS